MKTTTIDLIRHGEPEGGSLYRGNSIDDPLSEKGWSQMWAAVEESLEWEKIITSPLRRCRTFAEALANKHDLSVEVDDRLREVGFGNWEGQNRSIFFVRALVTYALGADVTSMYRINISNAGKTRIIHDQNGTRLQHHNL